MFKRSLVALFVSLTVVLSLLCSTVYTPVSAASTSEMRNEISDLEKKIADSVKAVFHGE